MTSALLCLGTWDYEGKRLPTWGPGIFPLGSWRPAHDRDQAPLMAPLQFTLNFTYDILGDDGSLEGLPDLKGLLGPGIPPSRPGSCGLVTFPRRGWLAYSPAPDPRHAIPAAPCPTGRLPAPPGTSAPRACGHPTLHLWNHRKRFVLYSVEADWWITPLLTKQGFRNLSPSVLKPSLFTQHSGKEIL